MEFLQTYLDHMVFGVLGLMSAVMMTFVFERWWFYRKLDLAGYTNKEDLYVDTTAHLTTISTVASNAPYVGLLGTVVGILLTFHQMGISETIDAKQIMVGLALALKATAAGLVVAIPAMVFYNGFMRRVDEFQARWLAQNSDNG